MSYPTNLDSFTTKIDGVDYPKASHINSLQTAVEGLEAKVGVDNSAVPTSIDYIIKNNIWPVGSVFISVVSTNPATLMGFGTWTAFGAGKTLIGLDDTDADFDTAEETGGAKTTSVAHTHAGPSHTHTGPSHTHSISNAGQLSRIAGDHGTSGFDIGGYYTIDHGHGNATGAGGTGTTGASGTGNTGAMSGNATPSTLQPYIVTYMWKRTA